MKTNKIRKIVGSHCLFIGENCKIIDRRKVTSMWEKLRDWKVTRIQCKKNTFFSVREK